jgi:hypothetical protein
LDFCCLLSALVFCQDPSLIDQFPDVVQLIS